MSPVDHADDRWPRAPFGSPDSPVNYSRGAFAFSREQRVRRRASLGTGQSGAPQAGADFVEHSQFFSTSFPLFLAMSLILR
jgi:hypothetical protein